MPLIKNSRVLNRSVSKRRLACVTEAIEPRMLFNATLTSAVAPVSVAAGATPTTIDLSAHFNDPTVVGTAVEIQTPQGNIPLTLQDAKTPKTVANFLHYISAGEYNGTIIHRVASGFVVQGGGYTVNGAHIPQFAPVPGEPGISNTTGTIAMALSSGPDSGTSEWFINLTNNNGTGSTPNLDNATDGGPFTAFGNVIYNGMSVVNAIAALPQVNDSQNPPGNGAWSSLPVHDYTGPSPSTTSVPPANLESTNTVVVPKLSYSVSSDNPAIVAPTVSGSALTLTYGGATGTAHVTVTATDLGGNVSTTSFAVGVGVTQVNVGKGSSRLIRFTDADGTFSQVSISGPGTATVSLTGSGLTQKTTKSGVVTVSGTPQSISISTTGTTKASALNISGHGGNRVVNVSSLTTDAGLRAVNAPNTVINGIVGISGFVGTMTVDQISGSNLHAGSVGHLTVRDSINASTLRIDGSIGSLVAGGLTNSSVFAGVGSAALPTSIANFSANATIGSVRIGRGGFVNSNVAAETVGHLNLGTIQSTGATAPFGVAGHTVQSLTGVAGKRIHLGKTTTQAQVTSAFSTEQITPGEFVVRIV
jgi:peptidyl-prolyl cis-trans isomerase A (cyclophilin A)